MSTTLSSNDENSLTKVKLYPNPNALGILPITNAPKIDYISVVDNSEKR